MMLIVLLAAVGAISLYVAASRLVDPRNVCGKLVEACFGIVIVAMLFFDGFSGHNPQHDRYFFTAIGLLGIGLSVRGMRLQSFGWAAIGGIFGVGFALAGAFDFVGQEKLAGATYPITMAVMVITFFVMAAIGGRLQHSGK